MKKIIRLTESDLGRIINCVILESEKKPSLLKIYQKIYDVLEHIGYDGWNEEFVLSYGPLDSKGLYTFKLAFFGEKDFDLEKISKKVMNELSAEFGEKYFELGQFYKRHFNIKINKLA
jgi:hypothetical protein